uniref:Uncharacterized protein n=1 Tax=Rhizophora mucronata TaxID=61149 RepID=A0A2P2NQ72_RHIMU
MPGRSVDMFKIKTKETSMLENRIWIKPQDQNCNW